ncbi:MAG: tetratricopeptide repeat protein, partial [Candidatus Aminicenantes bacterium]|nr:tetratricopeptide repeat protein [Candidatus Aminicenantes bacterium]
MDIAISKVDNLIKLGQYDIAFNIILNQLSSISLEAKPYLLLKLSLLNWIKGDLSEYYKNASLALDLSKKLSYTYLTILAENYIKIFNLYEKAKSLRAKGLYQDSISLFKQAINLSQSINSPHHELKCRRLLSISYWSLNDYHNFFNENIRALEIARQLNHSKEQCRCLNNLGLAYWKFDNYNEALNHFFEALKIARSINSIPDESDIISNIAVVYRDIGNFDKAIEFINTSIQLDEKTLNYNGIFINKLNLGYTFRQLFLLTRNFSYINNAIGIYKELLQNNISIDLKVKVLNNIASAYNDISEFHTYIYFLNQALELANLIKSIEDKSLIFINLGIVYFNLGNYEKAIESYKMSLELASKLR